MCCSTDCFLAIIAVLFPPIAVWVKVGICSADSLINIALLILGYIPGLLHAWYIILQYPENEDYPAGYQPIVGANGCHPDTEAGRVTYYYVSHQPPIHHSGCHPHPQRSYGTTQPPVVNTATRPVPQSTSNNHQAGTNGAPGEVATGEGCSGNRTQGPPTYAEAVKGDYKIQTQD
ncbi:hypothetical protein PABG_04803 [Paracoccidioides brasiliensis Pb03]|uniref:Uncharacterized protein n=1 Tax=Paracoccidioides brasiliensis TaxID=121759 RepID=A0A1D2JAR9_PARBR|nr:hypothetical protein PABG_04803 [Paracoccidioides brasiliensis Pb03]ODH24656.1 hypothetical protein ACO22_05303 [Paracoccidioides brasiliensis]ODH49801.1 hypothetical protein GX48_04029 [Paracoccidioides brasiliensis]